jgi:hypothetical protein
MGVRTDVVMFGMGNGQRVPSLVDVYGKRRVLIAVLVAAWAPVNAVGWHVADGVGPVRRRDLFRGIAFATTAPYVRCR